MPRHVRSTLSEIAAGYAACSACLDLGVPSDPNRLHYSSLAMAAAPERVRVLFIAESAPALNKHGRRSYFYLPEDDPQKQDASGLFWAVAEVLGLAASCGANHMTARAHAPAWKGKLLAEFSSRGLWLLDSAKCAVNGLPEGKKRNAAVGQCAKTWLKLELELLAPQNIVLLKTNVFRELRPLLVRWGLAERVLNDCPIPHPGSGHQVEFRNRLGSLVRSHPSLFGV